MIKAIIALVMAVFIVTGCSHNADHSHEGEQNKSATDTYDYSEKESYTLYSKNLELFVEFDPLISGENSIFLVHITDLNTNYSPLENAGVKAMLEIDREVKQNFEGQPVIAGIYELEVSPQFSGEGKLVIDISTLSFSDRFEIEHIHIFKEKTDLHTHGAVTGEVNFLKEQAWNTDFNVELIEPRSFSKVINVSGELLAMPGEKQSLVAKHKGIVMFSTRNLVQGSPVKKGELIFNISSKGFTDDNISVQFQEARLAFEKSKSQYLRHKNLVDEKIVTQRQFVESRNQYQADSVQYFYLKRNVSDGGVKVFSPLTGYIHELNVSEGQFASTGSMLATISSNKVMLLRADVPQQYFNTLGKITDATFRPAYSEKVYTIEELGGKLLAKASSVAENNHYMPVYFEVNNDGTLLEGAFAEFHLKSDPLPGKFTVPVSALIEEQNTFYVYLQISGETYLKKQVQIGDSDGINSEVLSGLKAGDRVVIRGAMLLKASSVSSAPVTSHSH